MLGLVSVISSAASVAAAGPPSDLDPTQWIKIETRHFVIYSNSSEANTRRIGADLESLHSALSSLSPDGDILSPLPTKIYVFRDDESFDAFKPRGMSRAESRSPGGSVAGFFHSAALGNYVALNGDPRSEPSATIYHEYLHYFARHNLPRGIPLWLNEGLAEYYSTFTTTETRALVGLPKERYLELLRTQPHIPYSELLAIDTSSRVYHQGKRRAIFYAQSWALVHYLLSDDQRALGLRRFLEALTRGESAELAFRAALDLSPLELEIGIERYLGRVSFAHAESALTELENTVGPASTLEPAELSYQLGDLLLRIERVDLAGHFFRRALDFESQHARAHAGLGEIADLGGNGSGALVWFEEAARLAPDDPLPHFLLGDLLLRRAADSQAAENQAVARGQGQPGSKTSSYQQDLERCREELEQSVRLNPDFSPGLAALGATYLLEPVPSADAESGVRALERAAWLQPDRASTVLHLATLLSRLQRFEEASRVIEQVLVLLDEPEVVTRARLTVARDRLEAAARLVDRGQPEQGRIAAQAVADEVLSNSSDASVRSFVLERSAEITRVADHNLAIALYRSALDAAGRGQRDEALDLLDQIETSTRDSEILDASRTLRRRLAG